ncbi:hypothetical protein CC78DRAFT_578290 [Lojkania enalia]|uniref:Uncharacterized protein n=1 Tax=Lojkania enalia TaxID=147567 RepID=A0A9P4N1M8_9PLEO|nr:hypothetical protein CC78DRAFT_578290 [Didymosphaeria enalia]
MERVSRRSSLGSAQRVQGLGAPATGSQIKWNFKKGGAGRLKQAIAPEQEDGVVANVDAAANPALDRMRRGFVPHSYHHARLWLINNSAHFGKNAIRKSTCNLALVTLLLWGDMYESPSRQLHHLHTRCRLTRISAARPTGRVHIRRRSNGAGLEWIKGRERGLRRSGSSLLM